MGQFVAFNETVKRGGLSRESPKSRPGQRVYFSPRTAPIFVFNSSLTSPAERLQLTMVKP